MKTLRLPAILVVAILMAACSPVKVVTDIDKTVDFTKYETYSFMGWQEASDLIVKALTRTIHQGTVTYDLARQMPGSREVKCSEFGARIVENMKNASG